MTEASRAARETPALAWVVGALVATVLPHAPHLPAWVLPLFLAGTGWRLALALRRRPLPSWWLRLLLAAGAFVLVYSSQRGISGVGAGTTLLVVMIGLKMLETRSRRDHILLIVLAYFLILASFLRSQDPLLAIYQCLATWVVTTALLQVTRRGGSLPAREAARVCGRLMLQALPVMLVLFVLFPRIPGPFWALPKPESAGVSGLDEEMTPGTIARLTLSDEVAFRVTFLDDPPDASRMYWRGPVLDRFDGRSWTRSPQWRRPAGDESLELLGPGIEYQVSLPAHGKHWMFALDMPASPLPPGSAMNRQLQLLSIRPIRDRTAYTLRSHPDYRTLQAPEGLELSELTYMPDTANPRTRELGQSLRAAVEDDRAFIRAVLEKFNREPFVYTLQPAPLGLRHPTDDFLFETREGFCEYYASAFAVLMRSAGLPARVVTGYQGGEFNPFSDYLVVRQSSAHAWVEVWLDEAGWVRVDPTAAVAPERIRDGLPASLQPGDLLPGGLMRSVALLEDLRMVWDLANARWDDWVLGYGPDQQMDLLARFGLVRPNPVKLVLVIVALTGIFLLLLTLYLARHYRPVTRDPALVLYRRFRQRLAGAGIDSPAHEAPGDLARRIARERPDLGQVAGRVIDAYLLVRYRPHTRRKLALEQLRRALRQFKPGRLPKKR